MPDFPATIYRECHPKYLLDNFMAQGADAKVYLTKKSREAYIRKSIRRRLLWDRDLPAHRNRQNCEGLTFDTLSERLHHEYRIATKLQTAFPNDSPFAKVYGISTVKSIWRPISTIGYDLYVEYIKGNDLRLGSKGNGLSKKDKLRIAFEIGNALYMMHTQGLVYVDIKPGNFIVSEFGKVKLFDFGYTCNIGQHSRKGSIGFMSPEHLYDGELDEKSDLFAWAVLIYRMLGGPPLDQQIIARESLEGPVTILGKATKKQGNSPLIEGLNTLDGLVSRDLKDWLIRSTMPERKNRFKNFHEALTMYKQIADTILSLDESL